MTSSKIEPSARNLPVQKRAREKYEQILRETCALLEESGFVGLSTREIARRADCNIATIYRYFGGVNDIVNGGGLAVSISNGVPTITNTAQGTI